MRYHITLTEKTTRDINALIMKYNKIYGWTPEQIVEIILENVLNDTAYAPNQMLEQAYLNKKNKHLTNKTE